MKSGWTEMELGEVSRSRLGKMLSPAAKSGSAELPYLGNAEVRWGALKLNALRTMSFSAAEQEEFSLRQGDVLICEGGEVGRSSVVERDLPGVYFQKAIHRVRCSPELDPYYLFRYMEFAAPTGRLDDFSSEATIKHLTGVKLRRLPIPLPPIEDQRRIAAVLDSADALRAKRRQAIAKLDTLTQAIFIDMFGDPVRNDRRWPKVAFEELCPTHLGKMLDEKQQTGLHPKAYLRNANVRWFGFSLSDVPVMDFSPKDQNRYRLKAGDVLICEGGEPGRAAVWAGELDDCYFQKALHRGKPVEDRATGLFVVRLLSHLASGGGLRDSVSTATISHLTGAKLKRLPVIAPPIDLQHEFDRRLNHAIRRIDAAQQSLDQLDDLFASLQQRAFRAEL